MPVLEKVIERGVRADAEEMGYLVLKVQFFEGGYPDRLFISPKGVHVYIEFKRPGEVPEPRQNYRISELRNRNVIAFWSDNYDESILALQAVLDAPFVPEESDTAYALAGIRRAVLGSGIRKDLDRSGLLPDTPEQRARAKDAHCCPFTTSLQGLAG